MAAAPEEEARSRATTTAAARSEQNNGAAGTAAAGPAHNSRTPEATAAEARSGRKWQGRAAAVAQQESSSRSEEPAAAPDRTGCSQAAACRARRSSQLADNRQGEDTRRAAATAEAREIHAGSIPQSHIFVRALRLLLLLHPEGNYVERCAVVLRCLVLLSPAVPHCCCFCPHAVSAAAAALPLLLLLLVHPVKICSSNRKSCSCCRHSSHILCCMTPSCCWWHLQASHANPLLPFLLLVLHCRPFSGSGTPFTSSSSRHRLLQRRASRCSSNRCRVAPVTNTRRVWSSGSDGSSSSRRGRRSSRRYRRSRRNSSSEISSSCYKRSSSISNKRDSGRGSNSSSDSSNSKSRSMNLPAFSEVGDSRCGRKFKAASNIFSSESVSNKTRSNACCCVLVDRSCRICSTSRPHQEESNSCTCSSRGVCGINSSSTCISGRRRSSKGCNSSSRVPGKSGGRTGHSSGACNSSSNRLRSSSRVPCGSGGTSRTGSSRTSSSSGRSSSRTGSSSGRSRNRSSSSRGRSSSGSNSSRTRSGRSSSFCSRTGRSTGSSSLSMPGAHQPHLLRCDFSRCPLSAACAAAASAPVHLEEEDQQQQLGMKQHRCRRPCGFFFSWGAAGLRLLPLLLLLFPEALTRAAAHLLQSPHIRPDPVLAAAAAAALPAAAGHVAPIFLQKSYSKVASSAASPAALLPSLSVAAAAFPCRCCSPARRPAGRPIKAAAAAAARRGEAPTLAAAAEEAVASEKLKAAACSAGRAAAARAAGNAAERVAFVRHGQRPLRLRACGSCCSAAAAAAGGPSYACSAQRRRPLFFSVDRTVTRQRPLLFPSNEDKGSNLRGSDDSIGTSVTRSSSCSISSSISSSHGNPSTVTSSQSMSISIGSSSSTNRSWHSNSNSTGSSRGFGDRVRSSSSSRLRNRPSGRDAALQRTGNAASASTLEELLKQQQQQEQQMQQQQLQQLSTFEPVDEQPPLAAHGPEDPPSLHVPGVWHFYFPRCMYTAVTPKKEQQLQQLLQQGREEEKQVVASKNGKHATQRPRRHPQDEDAAAARPPKAVAADAYVADGRGVCGQQPYGGAEIIFLYEDHTAIIPSLFARGNWATVEAAEDSPLQNPELRLCVFSSRAAHERLLLRGLLATSKEPVVSLWDERLLLHSAQAAGAVFVHRNPELEAAAAAAAALPPHVQVLDPAGRVLLEGSNGKEEEAAATATTGKRAHADPFRNAAATGFQRAAGCFTAYRVLGEDSNYFKVQHYFLRTGPKKLYHVVEPAALACGASAAAAASVRSPASAGADSRVDSLNSHGGAATPHSPNSPKSSSSSAEDSSGGGKSSSSDNETQADSSSRLRSVVAASFLTAKKPLSIIPKPHQLLASAQAEAGGSGGTKRRPEGDGDETQATADEGNEDAGLGLAAADPFSPPMLQQSLERVLLQFETDSPAEVAWPVPRVPKRAVGVEGEEED